MKKMNSKGFTLIELLAVITIMGILMMVAIPSVSRTIENARRDTFANIAHEYINSVRNNVLSDGITCKDASGNDIPASATANGWYYFRIDTTKQETKDLMETGGKSPFGNTDIKGYILWNKTTKTKNGKVSTSTVYYSNLVDTGKHGYTDWLIESNVKRVNITTSAKAKKLPVAGGTITDSAVTVKTAPLACKLA